jgi:hypothetical protein
MCFDPLGTCDACAEPTRVRYFGGFLLCPRCWLDALDELERHRGEILVRGTPIVVHRPRSLA